MTPRPGAGPFAPNEAAAWVVGCWLVLGCQAFAAPEDDRFEPFAPPPRSFSSPGSSGGQGPRSTPVPTPDPFLEAADAGDSGVGTAPGLDAAPLEDAGAFQDAAVDASPAAGDGG